MGFDRVVASEGRLRILTALARSTRGEEGFVELRRVTSLSDGNLSAHARKLAVAGYVSIRKEFREGKPVTRVELTRSGRVALECHARDLLQAIEREEHVAGLHGPAEIAPEAAGDADEWVD